MPISVAPDSTLRTHADQVAHYAAIRRRMDHQGQEFQRIEEKQRIEREAAEAAEARRKLEEAIDAEVKQRSRWAVVVESDPFAAARIMKTVATEHGLTVADLTGSSRRLHVVKARAEAIRQVDALNRLSLKRIADLFGRKDHTTISNALGRTKVARRRAAR